MSISAVISCLEEMHRIHSVLLELADQKKEVLISNSVDRLNQIIHKENQYVRQIAELDKERAEAVNQFLISKCYRPNPKVTISDLVQLLFKAEEKMRLMDVQKQLTHVIAQLKKANELNQQLIQQSLSFIDYSLDLFIGPAQDDVTYQNPSHNAQGHQRRSMFDTRA